MNSDPKTRSRQELLKRGVVITVAVIIGFLIGVYLLGIIELSNMGGAPLICAEPMYKK